MNNIIVSVDDVEIRCQRPNGKTEIVSWAELQAVIIETNSEGPFAPDLYWILVGKNRGCVIPAGAEGENQLLERLQKILGFDNEAVIAAMSCVEDQRFLCWRRDGAGS
jgi:hypothetical protein